jgi:ribosome-interacting GTPase 1
MFGLMPYFRDALVALGIVGCDSEPTPITSLFSNLSGYHRILISGLDNAGKSSLLERHLTPNAKHVTTFTIFTVHHISIYRCGNITFHVMDIGASQPSGFHRMERAFFNQADAVIWVIDANDCDRHLESREELIGKVDHEDGMTKDAPLLILANKRDSKACLQVMNVSPLLTDLWEVENGQETRNLFFDGGSSALVNRPHVSYQELAIRVY